jgi:hypothetical protein
MLKICYAHHLTHMDVFVGLTFEANTHKITAFSIMSEGCTTSSIPPMSPKYVKECPFTNVLTKWTVIDAPLVHTNTKLFHSFVLQCI